MTFNIREKRDTELAMAASPYNVHDHLKGLSIDELKLVSWADRLPWHTLCLNLTGDINVGNIIRTSHCLGASSVTIFGRQRIDQRSLVGSSNYIKIEKVVGVDNNLNLQPKLLSDHLKARKMIPIFVECNGVNLAKINWKLSITSMLVDGYEPCLIMGNETGGIPSNILEAVNEFAGSFIVSIPQRGVIRSFNVSSAHAMVSASMCQGLEWL